MTTNTMKTPESLGGNGGDRGSVHGGRNTLPLRIEDFSETELQGIKARFWSKVDQSGGLEACWPWTASRRGNEYGSFWINGQTYKTNRVVWMLEQGETPTDKMVLHSCNNPLCCNPKHLYLGNNSNNVRDAQRAGTFRCTSDLTADEKAKIKALYASGRWSQTDLAEMFGTTGSTIWKIIHGYKVPDAAQRVVA
jgi:hypothetical protein